MMEPELPAPSDPTDVEVMHRSLARELPEPTEGREPAPRWMWVVIAIALFGGGMYFGQHHGSLTTRAHIGFLPPGRLEATGTGATIEALDGPTIFRSRCATCHQSDGRGVPGVYPPLVGSEWVNGDPRIATQIVLRGLSGPIMVAGARFNNEMPAWGDMLSDAEIAGVVSHVRGLAGAGPIDASFVAAERSASAARSRPWSAEELRAQPGGGP